MPHATTGSRPLRYILLLAAFFAIILTGCTGQPIGPKPTPAAPAPAPLPVLPPDSTVQAALQQSGVKSPDGTWVAGAVLLPDRVGVWLSHPDGSNLIRLSHSLPPAVTPPLWTPTGDVLFLSDQLVWQSATTQGVIRPLLPDRLAGTSARLLGFTPNGRLIYLTNWCYCLTPEADRRIKELWTVDADGKNPVRLSTLAPVHDPAAPGDSPVYLQPQMLGVAGGFAVVQHPTNGTKPGTLDSLLEAIRLDGRQTRTLVRQPLTPDHSLQATVTGDTVSWQYVELLPPPPASTPPAKGDTPAPPPAPGQKILASGGITLSALVYENPALGVRWTPPATWTIAEAADNQTVTFQPEGSTCSGSGCPAVVIRRCSGATLATCLTSKPPAKLPTPTSVTVGGVHALQYLLPMTEAGRAWSEQHTIVLRAAGALDLVAITSESSAATTPQVTTPPQAPAPPSATGQAPSTTQAQAPSPADTAVLDTYHSLLNGIQFTGK